MQVEFLTDGPMILSDTALANTFMATGVLLRLHTKSFTEFGRTCIRSEQEMIIDHGMGGIEWLQVVAIEDRSGHPMIDPNSLRTIL